MMIELNLAWQDWCNLGTLAFGTAWLLASQHRYHRRKLRERQLLDQVQLFVNRQTSRVEITATCGITRYSAVGLAEAAKDYGYRTLAIALGRIIEFLASNHPENTEGVLKDVAEWVSALAPNEAELFLRKSDAFFPVPQGIALRSAVVNLRSGRVSHCAFRQEAFHV